MSKWINGIPKEDGLYWFYNGLDKHNSNPLILQNGLSPYVFGNNGSMPLYMVYKKDICPDAKHMKINIPDKWKKLKSLSNVGNNKKIWIKTQEDYIGFGLLEQEINNLCGTIIWINNPTVSSESGIVLRIKDNYNFCVAIIPD